MKKKKSSTTPAVSAKNKNKSPLRIATFNANSIRVRMQILLNWLEKNQPDVLAVQETKVRDEEFPRKNQSRQPGGRWFSTAKKVITAWPSFPKNPS